MRWPRIPTWGEVFLFLGMPKTGKSTFAASFPEVVVINTDGKTNERRAYRNVKKCFTVVDLPTLMSAIGKIGSVKRWMTLVVDVIDRFPIWIDDDICGRKKVISVSEIVHGNGWDLQSRMFYGILDKIMAAASLNQNLEAVIFISHCGFEDGRRGMIIRNALRKYFLGVVDHIGLCEKEVTRGSKPKFTVDFSGGATIDAGSRDRRLQAAGPIEPTYQGLVDFFTPDEDQWEKAMKAIGERGIGQEAFLAWALEDRDAEHPAELFELARDICTNETFCQSVLSDLS